MASAADPEILLTTRRFRVERVLQAAPDGSVRPREIVRHPGAVTIVPLVDPDHVCLIRNRRVSVAQTLIELPAGTREAAEPPEQTAARELQEETGYQAARWTELSSFFTSPGVMDEQMVLFLAEGLSMVGAAREPGEEIENLVVSWDEALRMVQTGQIRDAKSLVGLLLVEQLRQQSGGLPTCGSP